jgi:hypothetical protein
MEEEGGEGEGRRRRGRNIRRRRRSKRSRRRSGRKRQTFPESVGEIGLMFLELKEENHWIILYLFCPLK